jgi:hypothetical protein
MNLISKFSAKYPENSIGGQCAVFAEQLIDCGLVGNSYAQKKQAVQAGGILASNLYGDFRIGDVVISSEGTFLGVGAGHVAVIADIHNGQPIVAESNFRKDGRVHYGRAIPIKNIYGVIRGAFKIDLKLPPLVLKTTILMQYQTEWNSAIFQELIDNFKNLTGGKVTLDIYPVYTYNSLKNWYYQEYPFSGANYSVIAYPYIQEQAIPITYGNSQLIIWAINKAQWQGTVASLNSQYQEYGWSYFGIKPCISTVTCDEGDMSFRYPNEKAFIHYITHELSHQLTRWGRGDGFDYTDIDDINNDRSKPFTEIDYQHLAVNLL